MMEIKTLPVYLRDKQTGRETKFSENNYSKYAIYKTGNPLVFKCHSLACALFFGIIIICGYE